MGGKNDHRKREERRVKVSVNNGQYNAWTNLGMSLVKIVSVVTLKISIYIPVGYLGTNGCIGAQISFLRS